MEARTMTAITTKVAHLDQWLEARDWRPQHLTTHLDTHDEPVEGCKWCEDQSDS